LLAGFVKANQRELRIVRTLIDCQHLFHRAYEGATCFRRNDPLFPKVWLKRVFFSVW
jgi:hypothetical protein